MSVLHHALHFRDRNDRQEATEQGEHRKEQSETTDQHQKVDPGRMEIGPTRWLEVTTQRRDRDHKSLEPHADVHENANHHHEPGRRATPFDPKHLRD